MPKYISNKLFVFLVFRSFSKIRIFFFFFFFYAKILSCVEINLFEFRSQIKIPPVSEVWISFTAQLGLFIKIWTENTFFTCGREVENYGLNIHTFLKYDAVL